MTPERWRQIEDLFHGARALPPEERAAWLAAACADDADLRQEVASLLAQEDGTLLREGLAAAASIVMPPPPRANHEGRTLGPYTLGPLLGSGGMGDVYRARDERLGRDVAIKLLPDAVAASPDRLARFEREARVLGALNHPHIGAIHGLEQTDGLRGLVLELIEGPTLKERLDRGALPLEDSLRTARQIADALQAAHRKGIVHRDLKPSNIALSDRAVAKVLDFGIAKFDDSDVPGEPSVVATREGLVLGTVAYMSPEQARGFAVDKRTDIWAFGCVLYEMLTGARPFPGDTTADVLGAVTGREPDWTALPAGTPRRVRDLLRRCLAKDPDRRLHDIADARIEIDDALADPGTPDEQEAAARFSRRGAPMALWAIATLMTLAASTAAWMVWRGSDGPASRERGVVRAARAAIPLPEGVSVFEIGRGSSVAVSPDGTRIAYVGIANGHRRLYVRSLDDSNDRVLLGTDDATSPFFSPDGRWIGYIEGRPAGSLKKVSFDGGDPITILDGTPGTPPGFAVSGGWWAADDTIVVSVANPDMRGVWRLAATGGTPSRIVEAEGGMGWPQLLDRGDALIYTSSVHPGFDGSRIVVQPLDGEPKTLVERAVYGRVVTTGSGRSYLVYARAEGLEAAAFDPVTLSLTGPAVPVLPGVQTNLSGGAFFSVSRGGLLAYVPGGLTELDKTAVWVDRDGRETEIGVIRGLSFEYRLSPDGLRLVTPGLGRPSRDLLLADLAEPGLRQITFGGIHHMPVWTPDGRIIYAKGSPRNLFIKSASPSEDEERLAESPHDQHPGSVSRDGRWLAYSEDIPERSRDIFLMSLEKPYDRRPLISTPMGDMKPAFSPDGRWLAYMSGGTDTFEIYLASVDGDQRHIPLSKGPGWNPLWSRNGREVYYRSINPEQGGDMMVVSVDTSGPEPRTGKPRVLFPSPYQGEGDVGPDGRFLLLRFRQESPTRFIQLIFNWFEELEAKVPHPLSSPR
jgi:eukaryotic-like serine/threonine-protein kinase